MSARRSRSRSRSGATGERDGDGARRSDPAFPPPPLRRSQRKSGSAPLEAPPQRPSPAPRTAIILKKIVAPAAELSQRGSAPRAGPPALTPRAQPPGAPETPTSQSRKSAAKRVSPSAEVTHLEKENSPPLQESVPLSKGSCPLTASPALAVSTTLLGPLAPNVMPKPELMDARDLEMSRKVRRSYSRLDDGGVGSGATPTPHYRRQSFFGFERLLSGEELENISLVVKESKSQAVTPTAETWGPDSSLPGITVTKEKRRKRRAVPGILKSELDEWAAAMNAQFEAAEKFDLLVE